MGLLGIILGAIGFVLLFIDPTFGVILLIFGALVYLAGSNAQKRQTAELQRREEAQRHEELLTAVRQGKTSEAQESALNKLKKGPPL